MYKRGGKWWVKIRHEGRTIQRSTGTGEKRLAQKIEAQVRAELTKGQYFKTRKGEKITVQDLMEIYFEKHSKVNKCEYTQKNEGRLSKRILEHFGDLYLNHVTPTHIESFITSRGRDGVSDTTIHHELALMKHAFKLALKKWDLIDVTPFDKVTLPKGDKQRTRFLTREEADQVLAASPEWLTPIIIVALNTGLRISNLTFLTWKQADVFNRTIHIEKTKNGKPVSIPMTDQVYKTLNELRRGNNVSLAWVFPRPDGKPYYRDSISKAFKRTCREVGINDITFHGLRHTFCSWLAIEGANPVDIAALAGHEDLKSTMRYSHLNQERKREVIKRLERN